MPSSSSGSWTGSSAGSVGPGPPLRQCSRLHDLAAEADGVLLVDGQEVGQPRHAGVHRGAAELLVGGLLAGRHLDQRRAAQEDLRALLDHHHVVAHARDVGPAGGGVAEDQRHGRDGRGRVAGDVPEGPPPRDEQLGLGRQVRPARLGEADRREPVGQGDVGAPGALAERPRVHGPAPDGGVGGVDEDLDPFDHADPEDGGGADGVLGAPGGERAQLEERGVPVEEQLDPLPGGQLAPLAVPGHVALAAAGPGRGQLGVDELQALEQGALVGPERCPSSGRWWWGVRAWGSLIPWWGRCIGRVSHRPGRRGKNRPMTSTPRDDIGRAGPVAPRGSRHGDPHLPPGLARRVGRALGRHLALGPAGPPAVGRGAGRRPRHPHALGPPEAAAPAVRPPDDPARARRPGRAAGRPGSSWWSATGPSGSPRP